MAWAFQTGNGSASHTITLSVTAGDLIVVWFGWGSGTLTDLTSISDTVNTYTLFTGASDGANSQSGRGGWTVATTTTSLTITGNGISGFSYKNAVAGSYRESGTISFIGQNQQFASFTTATDNVSSGNVTPSAVGDLIIGYAQNTTAGAGTLNAGTSYTIDAADAANPSRACALESRIAASTSAQSATFTQGAADGQVVAAMVFNAAGGAATATTFTGPSTGVDDVQSTDFTVGANGTITGTVTCTFTNSLSGTWSFATRDISSGTPTQTVKYTPSVPGTHVLGVTDNGGLTDATSINYVVASVSRPSAVTAGSWTDEAGGSLVVTDINDASDSTGAKDPAGASYPVLAFTMDTPMAASVAQTCYFRGNDVTAGKQIRQVLFANDGTTVVATGAWKTMTGSLATYSDTLTPTATAYKGEIQTQAVPTAVYGVIWPSNLATDGDVRLNWTGSASVSRTAQTIIWKSKYTAQNGYYAVWWRLPDAAATFDSLSLWYCGTHPWPGTTSVNGNGAATGGTGSTGTVHQFEIATIGTGADYITSPSAANGGPFTVTKGVWQTEAATVEVISGTTLRHTYWPDITNTTSFIRQDRTLASLDTPTAERVVFGGSPWRADTPTAGKTDESASGTFRYWKMFSAALSITDIATEAASNSDSAVTTAGIASAFYSNINPTPTDVTDKSGNGHDPAWANSNRPTLYTG